MNARAYLILHLVTCLFASLLAAESHAQQWAQKMFKELSHDFGDVTKGERPVHRFEIQNIYKEDIRIASVVSSCGCTTVSATKNVLKMWEKGEIVCQFNSPAFDGFKQATVTVRFSRPFVGEVQLNIKGNIVAGLNVKPRSIDFGEVSTENLPEQTVQLTSAGNPNFRVVDIKSTFSHIKVQLKEQQRQANLVSYQLTTSLKPDVPPGFTQGELYVVVQEGNVRREVPISFTARVRTDSSIQLSPAILTLNGIKPGQEVKKKVIVKGSEPFRIVDVTCHSRAFRVKAGKEAKKIHFVEVIYTGEDEPGKHECELSFYTDISGDQANKILAVVDIVPDDTANALSAELTEN